MNRGGFGQQNSGGGRGGFGSFGQQNSGGGRGGFGGFGQQNSGGGRGGFGGFGQQNSGGGRGGFGSFGQQNSGGGRGGFGSFGQQNSGGSGVGFGGVTKQTSSFGSATGGVAFGQQQGQQSKGFGSFGQMQGQKIGGPAFSFNASNQSVGSYSQNMRARQDFEDIISAYTPNRSFQFWTLFYRQKEDKSGLGTFERQEFIPSDVWDKFRLENPAPEKYDVAVMTPYGFAGLLKITESLEKNIEKQEDSLDLIEKECASLREILEKKVQSNVAELKNMFSERMHRLIKVMARMEVVRSIRGPGHSRDLSSRSSFSYAQSTTSNTSTEEETFRQDVDEMYRELNRADRFQGRINEMKPLADNFASNSLSSFPHLSFRQAPTASNADLISQMDKFLDEQREGIRALMEILRDDLSDVDRLENELGLK